MFAFQLREALKFMLLDLKYLIAVVESTQPQIGLRLDAMKLRGRCLVLSVFQRWVSLAKKSRDQ